MRFEINEERRREMEMEIHTKGTEDVTMKQLVTEPGKYWRLWAYLRFVLTGEREIMTDADERLDAYLSKYLGY